MLFRSVHVLAGSQKFWVCLCTTCYWRRPRIESGDALSSRPSEQVMHHSADVGALVQPVFGIALWSQIQHAAQGLEVVCEQWGHPVLKCEAQQRLRVSNLLVSKPQVPQRRRQHLWRAQLQRHALPLRVVFIDGEVVDPVWIVAVRVDQGEVGLLSAVSYNGRKNRMQDQSGMNRTAQAHPVL